MSNAGQTGETGVGETGVGETVVGETGMGEAGMGEAGMGEAGMGEAGMGEVGMGEVGAGGVGVGEAEVREAEVGEAGGMSRTAATKTLGDVAEEGRRLAERALAAGLDLRLIGGVGIWVHSPSARVPPLARSYGDADLVGRASDRKEIASFLKAEGYEPDKMFNAIHGASRLNFHDPVRERPLDVLLDRFSMAHELDLRDSRSPDKLTVSLADLLLSKLQVVSINEKDLRDLLALLIDHGFSDDEIDMDRILEVTHNDWGFERTIHGSLATLRDRIDDFSLPPEQARRALDRAGELEQALNQAPKGVKWKMRAKVGDRVKWYQEPEEARG